MPKYSVKIAGNAVKFSAKNQREAVSHAFRLSPYYSDLKRLESRWWLLGYVVLILLGLFAGW